MNNTAFRRLAIRAACKAGDYIYSHSGKIKNVRYKGDINVVTDIDKKAEYIIIDIIRKAFPSHTFLAEEGSHEKKGFPLSRSEYKWIIDPLDGTTNFLHEFPLYCVSVALEYQGKVITGCVYDPTRKEVFHAAKNKGSFLNKKRIRVSKVRKLKKALLATGFAYNINRTRNNNIRNFVKIVKMAQAVRRAGSAAIDLCYVASGRFDGFWELYLNPWDTAAGVLILEEAGGKVTKFNGSKFSIYDKEILATNSKIHSQLAKAISAR